MSTAQRRWSLDGWSRTGRVGSTGSWHSGLYEGLSDCKPNLDAADDPPGPARGVQLLGFAGGAQESVHCPTGADDLLAADRSMAVSSTGLHVEQDLQLLGRNPVDGGQELDGFAVVLAPGVFTQARAADNVDRKSVV